MKYQTREIGTAQCQAYLKGQGPEQQRAVLVPSLNEKRERYFFTFKLIPSLKPVSSLTHWSQLLRLPLLFLIMLPVLAAASKNAEPFAGFWLVLITTLFSLYFVVLVQSEKMDYMAGWDRIRFQFFSPIWQGQIGLRVLGFWQWVAMGIALVGGGYLAVRSSWSLWGPAFASIGLLGFWLLPPWRLKYRRASEWVPFLLFGPLLHGGIATLLVSSWSWNSIFFSVSLGLSAVLLNLRAQYANLMQDTRARRFTSLSYLGFDRSKFYIFVLFLLWWWVHMISLALDFGSYGAVLFFVLGLGYLYRLYRQLHDLEAPLGGRFQFLMRWWDQGLRYTLVAWGFLWCLKFWWVW